MSQYLILIYGPEEAYDTSAPAELAAMTESHRVFMADNQDAILGGEALQRTSTASTIRDGVVTDGAFAETKEALGGYYLIEAPDLDAALALAKQVPVFVGGGVEVRPIMVWNNG